jgi:hypothetical protein
MRTTHYLTLSDGGRARARASRVDQDAALASAVAVCIRRAPGTKSRHLHRLSSGEKPIARGVFAAVEELAECGVILDDAQQLELRDAIAEFSTTLSSALLAIVDRRWGRPTPPTTPAPAVRRVA